MLPSDIYSMATFLCSHLQEGLVELSESEAAHAARVLRLSIGQQVDLVDGKGSRASGNIADISKSRCQVEVNTLEQHPAPSPAIHIAIAPTKSIDRFEFFLEKATELGATRITPILCERSERKRLRHDRSLKVLIAAMKQSQRVWLPQLDELTPLQALFNADLPQQRFFGWCAGKHQSFMNSYSPADCLILIGPEGDFSEAEAEQLLKAEFTAVSIGNTRLRTETAGIAACAWLSLQNQLA